MSNILEGFKKCDLTNVLVQEKKECLSCKNTKNLKYAVSKVTLNPPKKRTTEIEFWICSNCLNPKEQSFSIEYH